MFKRICLPIDESSLSQSGFAEGVALARDCGASILIVTVVQDPYVSDTGSSENNQIAEAKHRLERAGAAATEAGVPYTSLSVLNEEPYRGIIDTADRYECDLIAMASHGRHGFRSLLGSTTQRVLLHSHIPVLVFTRNTPRSLRASVGSQTDDVPKDHAASISSPVSTRPISASLSKIES